MFTHAIGEVKSGDVAVTQDTAPIPLVRSGEVGAALNRNAASLSTLVDAIQSLCFELEPVLTPADANPVGAGSSHPPSSVPLVLELDGCYGQIQRATDLVMSIRSRLQL